MSSPRFDAEVSARAAARSNMTVAMLLGDLPPCPYPDHRPTDWGGIDGPLTCGVCHPRADELRAAWEERRAA